MEQIIDLPSNRKEIIKYGSFWRRALAYLIDSFIIFLALFILMIIVGGAGVHASFLPITWFIGTISYFPVMEASPSQGTIGKNILNLKVGDAEGRRITLGKAIVRYLGKIVSTVIFCVGFLMAGFHQKRQALHDIIAGTFVYYKR